jgi:hypothetical protein
MLGKKMLYSLVFLRIKIIRKAHICLPVYQLKWETMRSVEYLNAAVCAVKCVAFMRVSCATPLRSEAQKKYISTKDPEYILLCLSKIFSRHG